MKPVDTLQDAGKQNRRGFLKSAAASIVAGLAAGVLASPASGEVMSNETSPPAPARAVQDMMPTRNLGKTGFRVGIVGLRVGEALRNDNQSLPLQIIQRAFELGVNYFETSFFGVGSSERYLGKGLKGARDQVFIATKTRERTRDGALRNLDVSLKRLDTDHIDIWQLDDIPGDVDQIFGKGGAIEALFQAHEQKIVRHLGVTDAPFGVNCAKTLMECIRRFPFDTALIGVNAADKYQYGFEKDFLPLAVEKQMGIIGMDVPKRGGILAGRIGSRWPSPPCTLTRRETLFYTLSLPISTAIVGCDSVEQVEDCVELARSFTPLNQAQMAKLEAKVVPVLNANYAAALQILPVS